MTISTSAKYFHSSMPGAPVVSGTAGSRIAMFDACLVTGFGLVTATSVIVAGGVATATFPSGHSFEPDAVALIAGATPAGLNGEKRVLTTSTNTITFDATGITDQNAAGTITARVAPAGWEKAFSGTKLAVYRSLDPASTKMLLRVDDTGTTNVRVVGYESMTDVNTGVGPFPSAPQISGEGYWPAANAANATARAWTFFADNKTFKVHFHTATTNPSASGCVWGFGDFTSLKSGDAYACALQCAASDVAGGGSSASAAIEYCDSTNAVLGAYIPRSFTTLGGAVAARHLSTEYITGNVSGAYAAPQSPIYPNGPDNGLILGRKLFIEPSVCRRGVDRGVYIIPQNCHTAFSWRDKIDGQGALAGRKLLAVKCGSPAGTSSSGVVFFDITGPWE